MLCGNHSQDISALKARPCFPLPDLQPLDEKLETASKSSGKPSKAGSPPRGVRRERSLTATEAESEVTPSQAMMLEELASLQRQQALLEELMQLQELKDFEKALQEEEDQLEQALRQSALDAEEQELLKRKRSMEADETQAARMKTPKATPLNEAIFEAKPLQAGEAPAAILEPTEAESNEAGEAPAAILEPTEAESPAGEARAAILESTEAEARAGEAKAAILESTKAESPAGEAKAAILESTKAESPAGEAPMIRLEKHMAVHEGVVCFLVAVPAGCHVYIACMI